jgi:hypothetical protein
MKKSSFRIESFILILGLWSICVLGNSQGLNPEMKEKKESKKLEQSRNYEVLGSLLESRKFVFEGDQTQLPHESPIPGFSIIRLDSSLVFIESISLLLRNFSYDVKRWDLKKNPKYKFYTVRFYADGKEAGGFGVVLNIYANNSAVAEIGMKNMHHTHFIGSIRQF